MFSPRLIEIRTTLSNLLLHMHFNSRDKHFDLFYRQTDKCTFLSLVTSIISELQKKIINKKSQKPTKNNLIAIDVYQLVMLHIDKNLDKQFQPSILNSSRENLISSIAMRTD